MIHLHDDQIGRACHVYELMHILKMMFSDEFEYMYILFFWESIQVLRRGVIKIVLK